MEKRWGVGSGLTMPDAGGDGPNRLFGSILVVAGVSEGWTKGTGLIPPKGAFNGLVLAPTGPLSDVDLGLIFLC